MSSKVFVIGVGLTKFDKPGKGPDYPDLAREAVTKALLDAQVKYSDVEAAAVGYVYGDSTSGQRALYQFGLTQIPIINLNNNCSTGSTAIYVARQHILSGQMHCTLALGFEKMKPGSLQSSGFEDRANPLDWNLSLVSEARGLTSAPFAPQIFGNAGLEYCEKYGATAEHMAKIGEKNHRHSALNPYAQFQKVYTLEEIKNSPTIHGPLTKLQCSPTSDGAACVILASEHFVRMRGLESQAVEILAQSLTTDSGLPFETKSDMEIAGYDMSRTAAVKVYEESGIRPADIRVVELHDCFSANELITYEALSLCPVGKAHEMVDKGDNTFGGRIVVNPSGGLISKGHPLGATGLAQCSELVWQLRGWCGQRQVSEAKYALQHNIGLGGAAVVTLYHRNSSVNDHWKRLGYNPAVELRGVSDQDFERVAALVSKLSYKL